MYLADNISGLFGHHGNHNIGADLLLLVMGIDFNGIALNNPFALESFHGLLHCSAAQT